VCIVDELDRMPAADLRNALAQLVDCIALRKRAPGLSDEQRLVIFWAGEGPADLARRGFRSVPELRGFDLPPRAAVAAA